MSRRPHDDHAFVRHAWVFGALTLVSRVSGLIRDMVFSRVLGTSGVMSAWTTAFLVPNLFRRLFGEGALAAAFIPEYTRLAQEDPRRADQLASLTIASLVVFLGAITLVLEGALFALLFLTSLGETAGDVIRFAIIMLPYMPLVCATAMLGGMLQTHGRFAPGAAAPIILNCCMMAGALGAGVVLGASMLTISTWVSISVVAAGAIQALWCFWALRGLVRWTRAVDEARENARKMFRSMLPVLIGMGSFQIGTLVDGVLAGWPKIFGPGVPGTSWVYPLDVSAASVLYYAQRLYHFPLGVFGIAVATAVFPELARRAGEKLGFNETLVRGIRLSMFIGVPASVGLVLVREDITSVVYAGGEFGSEQITRVSAALFAYAPAIWAYSLSQLLTRAFYAKDLMSLPMRIGIASVVVNIVLNLVLIVPLKEVGLALATSAAGVFQCVALLWASRRWLRDDSRSGAGAWSGMAWSTLLSLAMGAAVLGVAFVAWPGAQEFLPRLLRLLALCATGGGVYLVLALVTKRPEVRWLLAGLVGRAGGQSEESATNGAADGR